jgi:ABC-type nitrate/sulfonate/bicarbonate transport system substrate-binding protein
MKKPMSRFFVYVFATLGLAGPLASVAQSQPKTVAPGTKVRIAIPSPSLSYLPIYVAVQRGFFARRGFDIAQSKAYIAMLTATANLSAEPAAASIFDFTTAAEAARELASSR